MSVSILTIVARDLRVVCACVFSFSSLYLAVFHWMGDAVSFVLPMLQSLAVHCALPARFIVCELTEDGYVLAGVEIELPVPVGAHPQRRFFWSVCMSDYLGAYEQAAMQAIRFLQQMYGFVIRGYNYECMLVYRESMRSAVVLAACAARYAGSFQREAQGSVLFASIDTGPLSEPSAGQTPVDCCFFCSRLVASLRDI